MSDRKKLLSSARIPATSLLLLSLMGFAGCSSVPDAVNPVEWYRGASEWFESDKDQAQRDQANTAKETAPPLPGSDKPYPNLSSVPERPRSVTSAEERNKVQQGLAADRANARYAKPEAGRPSSGDVGAPVAAPRTPVTVAPGGPSPDSLEALPPDIAPPPAPQSSRETPAPMPVAEASPVPPVTPPATATVDTPTIQPAAYQTAAAETGTMTDAAPMAAPATVSDAPPAPAPRSVPSQPQAELAQLVAAEPTAVAAAPVRVAQQASLPSAEASRSQDLPRSFMVYFAGGGTAALDGVDREVLREVARLHKSHGGTLRVVGHASSATRETDAYKNQVVNLRISTQRAEAVANELVRLGVPRDSMTVAGVSDSEPLYTETTQAGIAGNRRVEIFFGP